VAGVPLGSVILEVNGTIVKTRQDIVVAIGLAAPGSDVEFALRRSISCPSGHAMVARMTLKHGSCDGCGLKVPTVVHVTDCRLCNWCICEECVQRCGQPKEADDTDEDVDGHIHDEESTVEAAAAAVQDAACTERAEEEEEEERAWRALAELEKEQQAALDEAATAQARVEAEESVAVAAAEVAAEAEARSKAVPEVQLKFKQ
jgi:hypothetical protein